LVISLIKTLHLKRKKFTPNTKKGIFLGYSEKFSCYIIMDYYNFIIHLVRDINCLENVPANLKIQNNIKNNKKDIDFLIFSF